MTSHHQHHTGSEQSQGRVDGPGLLYGGVGLALAVAMQVIGLFKRGDARLQDLLLNSVFQGAVPDRLSLAVLVLVTAIFCFGIAFAMLDSAGTWRRVILGVTALVVVIAMVPTFAVWKIYFSPFLPAVGVFWTWFCTMMYVNHHQMPCERISAKLQTPLNPAPTAASAEPFKELGTEESEKTTRDPNAKYKPKKN